MAVLVNGHLCEWFQMTVGNRQGVDPLSPRSFALFLERIMDKIKNREHSGESVRGNRVKNHRFADDVDIFKQSNEKLQDTVDKLHAESERYGMHINIVKTKIMVYGKKPEENDAKVNIDRQEIENVKSFTYLGSEFPWDNDCSKDIQIRISLATAVLGWKNSIQYSNEKNILFQSLEVLINRTNHVLC